MSLFHFFKVLDRWQPCGFLCVGTRGFDEPSCGKQMGRLPCMEICGFVQTKRHSGNIAIKGMHEGMADKGSVVRLIQLVLCLARDAFMQTRITQAIDNYINGVRCELQNLFLLPKQLKEHGIEPGNLNSHFALALTVVNSRI